MGSKVTPREKKLEIQVPVGEFWCALVPFSIHCRKHWEKKTEAIRRKIQHTAGYLYAIFTKLELPIRRMVRKETSTAQHVRPSCEHTYGIDGITNYYAAHSK